MKKNFLYGAMLFLFLLGIPGISFADNPNIFGLEVGNSWTYDVDGGQNTEYDEVVGTQWIGSTKVYVLEREIIGEWYETQWLERKAAKVKLWGGTAPFDGSMFTLRFSTGLVLAWFPMQVGDSEYSSTTTTIDEYPGFVFEVSLSADVVKEKQLTFSFGTVTAYKISYQERVWGYGEDDTTTFVQWAVYPIWAT